ncbi:MAG TPA: tRNA (guanosine(37)-N1)-methyltransferase TrmD [Candidatus Paceibacterota bacterium]
MTFHIVTLFPDSFKSYINSSIIGRALRDEKIKIKFYNPRDYTKDKHRRIDRKPYAGGPGMVIEALPVIKAIEAAIKNTRTLKIIWTSPSGKQFDNAYAEKVSKKFTDIIIICGRYEGIDARVRKIFKAEQISVGPFVVTGGELPAMIILDTISRRIPGVLGKIESVEENRVASSDVYTRPEVFEYQKKKYKVPKILLSGHQKNIEDWKKSKNK